MASERLGLALACARPAAPGVCNRFVAEQVMRHVWEGGADAVSAERLTALQGMLAEHMALSGEELADPNGDDVKARLRTNTEDALAAGVFGVPTCEVDAKLFWGLDSLPMLRFWPSLRAPGGCGGCAGGHCSTVNATC